MARTLVALDLETTGLFPETDRVVEIGAVRFRPDGREVGRYERMVHPGRPMSPAAQAIHGISDADLSGAPPASVVIPEFLGWLDDPGRTRLLAHNARFDAGFLGRELARLGLPIPPFEIRDTLDLARRRLPGAPGHQLDSLARRLGLDLGPSHRALADSLRVKGLWLALGGDDDPSVATYPIFDPARSEPPPCGWDRLADAMARGCRVRMAYSGGSLGTGPREITPRRFVHKAGVAYVVALCHVDAFEKSFRLDRVVSYEVMAVASGPAVAERADRSPVSP